MLSTARRIQIARAMSTLLLRLGLRPERRIRRGGIVYAIDIREGIDLSLFLLGSFQKHVIAAVRDLVPDDSTVIDVGANIGAFSLPVASFLRRGRVHAIEPTDYASEKLLGNVALNPDLAQRVSVHQTFLADRTSGNSDLVAYSSWPVAGQEPAGAHPVHHGVAKKAACGQMTLDDFVAANRIERLDLVKIDTDGHEYEILSGARRTLETRRPIVIFEACGYLMQPPSATFDDFARLFAEHRYVLQGQDRKPIDAAGFAQKCPVGGGLDLIATPQ